MSVKLFRILEKKEIKKGQILREFFSFFIAEKLGYILSPKCKLY